MRCGGNNARVSSIVQGNLLISRSLFFNDFSRSKQLAEPVKSFHRSSLILNIYIR